MGKWPLVKQWARWAGVTTARPQRTGSRGGDGGGLDLPGFGNLEGLVSSKSSQVKSSQNSLSVRLLLSSVLCLGGVLVSPWSYADLIDFEKDTIGPVSNGFTPISNLGVHFTDTLGSGLEIHTHQALGGKNLVVFDDDASKLQINFDFAVDSLSLFFGNDDNRFSKAGDRAWLEVFNHGTSVGLINVPMNRNNLTNQSISISGVSFDSALFWYGDTTGTPITLIEAVDNISYQPSSNELRVSARSDTSDPNAVLLTCNITPPSGASISRYVWRNSPTDSNPKATKGSARIIKLASGEHQPACRTIFSDGTQSPWTTKLIYQVRHKTIDIAPTNVDLPVSKISVPLDVDGDALPDAWENYGVQRYDDNGKFSYTKNATPLPFLPLNDMGADALCKDIFVEVDQMGSPEGGDGHSHLLKEDAMENVRKAFANAPVDNLAACGHQGIGLHVDYGEQGVMYANPEKLGETRLWGTLTKADTLPHALSIDSKDKFEDTFYSIYKMVHFSPERRGVFHYAVSGHMLFPDPLKTPTGYSFHSPKLLPPKESMSTSNFMVTLISGGSNAAQAGTFMHELGHNLGLYHGGFYSSAAKEGFSGDDTRWKPNHLSVMNYSYQFPGLSYYEMSSTEPTNGFFDYSRTTTHDLNEKALDEILGVAIRYKLEGGMLPDNFSQYGTKYTCKEWVFHITGFRIEKVEKTSPIDVVNWNCKQGINGNAVASNINNFGEATDKEAKGNEVLKATLSEWDRLVYSGSKISPANAIGARFSDSILPQQPTTMAGVRNLSANSELEVDMETLRNVPTPHAVEISGLSTLKANIGRNYDLVYSIKNTGYRADNYKLAISSHAGWQVIAPIQEEVALQPGQSVTVRAIVSVPSNPPTDINGDKVTFRAISASNQNISDSVETRLQLE